MAPILEVKRSWWAAASTFDGDEDLVRILCAVLAGHSAGRRPARGPATPFSYIAGNFRSGRLCGRQFRLPQFLVSASRKCRFSGRTLAMGQLRQNRAKCHRARLSPSRRRVIATREPVVRANFSGSPPSGCEGCAILEGCHGNVPLVPRNGGTTLIVRGAPVELCVSGP